MKKIFTGALVIVLIMGSAFHFSIVYLNYIRTLGIGFTPGISIMKSDFKTVRKDILRAGGGVGEE